MTAFEALRRSTLLREFTDVGVRLLARKAVSRQVGRGAYAFRAGEPSESLGFIASGTLSLVPREGGAPLAELAAGDTVGGLALLAGRDEHLLSALASADAELFELSRASFDELSRTHPRACLKLTLALARDLASRLRDARAPLREFLLWQVSRR